MELDAYDRCLGTRLRCCVGSVDTLISRSGSAMVAPWAAAGSGGAHVYFELGQGHRRRHSCQGGC